MRKHAALAVLVATLLPADASAQPPHCPPGLANKTPPCVPPGLAKKQQRDAGWYYGPPVGGGYYILREPRSLRLDPRWDYYLRNDGMVVRVDPRTRAVIDIVDALDRLID
ncbi:excinuclease ABC subunit A [Rhodovulum tesquicola]|uniref:excinuclease ABC subunit A n=1 Tax=Rhodovulum tesquicola TaxID=540254 RepID=UPI0020985815|nr:excinuclease ABC subunit A [Rhodovulum tesquicola]MCO8144940.1 excinuclease ABC subunit A [Rhodovulum tesquicola]